MIITFLLFLLLIPACAFANIPLPTILAFSIPFWVAWSTMVVSFLVIVIIEAAILCFYFKQPRREALSLALKVNIITTLFGFGLTFNPLSIFGLVAVVVFAAKWMRTKLKWKALVVIPTSVLIGAIIVLLWIVQPTIPRMILQFYATMLFSFILTVFFEACLFAPKAGVRRAWRWSITANGVSYFIFFSALLIGGFRSGAFAFIDWPLHEIRRQRDSSAMDRQKVLNQIEELYEWEGSGKSWMLSSPLGKNPSPRWELGIAERWAKRGYIPDAEELFALISKYRKRPSDPRNYLWDGWKMAEVALTKARKKASVPP